MTGLQNSNKHGCLVQLTSDSIMAHQLCESCYALK